VKLPCIFVGGAVSFVVLAKTPVEIAVRAIAPSIRLQGRLPKLRITRLNLSIRVSPLLNPLDARHRDIFQYSIQYCIVAHRPITARTLDAVF
jgi:hypothetical protein